MKLKHILILSIIATTFSSCIEDCDNPGKPRTFEPNLDAATPVYPPNTSSGISRSPIFIWEEPVEGSGSYEFTIRVVQRFPYEEWSIPAGSDTIVQFPDTIGPENSCYWTVLVETSSGDSVESYESSFTTGTGFNNPPTRQILLTPASNGLDIPVEVTFSWYSFDPDGDEITYCLWYKVDGTTDSTFVPDLLVQEHTVGLDADTRYKWGVISRDDRGGEMNTFSHWFETISTSPPHTPFPSDGAEEVPLDVTLGWSCTDPDGDDLTYDVEMGRAGGSRTTIGSGLTQDELPVVGLTDKTTYEWKVTAEDDDGHITEGPVWSFSTIGEPGDVFADLTLTRRISKSGIETTIIDNIWARFDERYAPYHALSPLRPDTVTCGDIGLGWQEYRNRFYYENAHTLSFLVPGTSYEFSVPLSGGVPALTESILFPQCAPLITSPESYGSISLDGFTVTWSGYDEFPDCDKQIVITIEEMGGISTGVSVTTENDGSYTFTAGELSAIDPMLMDLQIVLTVENMRNIDLPGYDPRSWIRARTRTVQMVYVQ